MENRWFEELRRTGRVTLEEYAELYRLQAEMAKRVMLEAVRRVGEHTTVPFVFQFWRCFDRPGGRLLWTRTAGNLWTTAGANWLLQNAIYTVPTYLALMVGSAVPTFAIGDVASSHPGWTEVSSSDVVQTTRPAVTWGAPSGGVMSNSSTLLVYQMAPGMVGTRTLQGGALFDNNTLDGSTGNLISEAVYDQGPASVSASNQVNIQVTVTVLAG